MIIFSVDNVEKCKRDDYSIAYVDYDTDCDERQCSTNNGVAICLCVDVLYILTRLLCTRCRLYAYLTRHKLYCNGKMNRYIAFVIRKNLCIYDREYPSIGFGSSLWCRILIDF